MRLYLTLIILFSTAAYSFSQDEALTGSNKRQVLFLPQSKKTPKEIRPYINNMVYIPSGSFNTLKPDFTGDEKSMVVSVASFYMSNAEVPNWLYREFCEDMTDSLGIEKASLFMPDTTCWMEDDGLVKPMTEYYFRHPAYDNYPVVGVSFAQANLFCEWLTNKVKAMFAIYPKFEEVTNQIEFRLPTEMEWEWAATGMRAQVNYPWGISYFPKDEKGNLQIMANSGNLRDDNENLVIEFELDGRLLTGEVYEYSPNDFGLYNMSGNVSEWVLDVYAEYYNFNYDLSPSYTSEPEGIDKDSIVGVVKGGSWMDSPGDLRIWSRKGVKRIEQQSTIGFRVIMPYYGRGGRDIGKEGGEELKSDIELR